MPLVGRSMDVIGSLFGMSRAMMNKLMIPVALAVGAITAFTKAVIFASQALLDFRKSMAVGGGTPGQTIAGMRLDSLTGGNSAEDARRLQGLSAGGGVEASILRGMGFFQPGGFGRNPNAMTGLFGVLSKLRGQSGGQQDFNIQQLGLENYAGLIKDASPDQFRRAANQQGAGIGGRADRQAAINFKLGINDVGIAFKKLAPILTPVLNFIGTAARVLSQFIRALTLTVRSIFWFIDKITFGAASRTGLIPALNSGPGSKGMANVDSALDAWERWLNSQSKGDNSQDRNTSALDANTRGVQANTQAIKSIFGGDAGARGAVPDAWRFRMLGEARMQRQTAALGPFYEW